MLSRTKLFEQLGWLIFAVCAAGLGILLSGSAHAATYYVSNSGSDSNSGTAPENPWQTAGKVNATALQSGDTVYFARGGEWHERLAPTSSGAPGNPITFDAYGTGVKPKFWGSDVLDPAHWTSQGGNVYSYAGLSAAVTEVLANHGTGTNGQWFNAGSPTSQAGTFDYNSGTLRINSASDPRSDGRVYTAVTRQDVVASNGCDHLVFRNLQGDECADPGAGYVFRVEGSQDVTLDTCDAYRGGRHNFGVINSTGFVGKNLYAAYAMPNINGGATFYVSYSGSESNYSDCTSTYINCTGEHFDDGNGGAYQYFVCHGAKQGPIAFQNPIDKGGKFSILQENPAQAVSVTGGIIQDADYELFCDNVLTDGVTLTGNTAIDCYSKNCVFQNLLLTINPNGGGPTGYGSAIVFRSGAQNNTVRFCTVAMDPSTGSDKTCLTFAASNLPTSWYGNVFISTGRAVADWGTLFNNNGTIPSGDVVIADYNYYATSATFNNQNFAAWQANGFADQHSLTGAAPFNNAAGGDYTLKAGSTAIDAAGVPAGNVPNHDFNGATRPQGSGADMGAFEFNGNPPLVITTASLPDGTGGAAYATTLAATGGSGPYTWSIVAGALPSGLALNASGVLSGTPTVEGTFNITVQVRDIANATATQAWTFSIQKKTAVNHAPSINSGPSGNPGTAYAGDTISFSASATDPDQDPLTYTWVYGDGASGSGAATTHAYISAGTYIVTLTVTDPGSLSDHKSIIVVIAAALSPNNGGTTSTGNGGNNSGNNTGGTNGGDSGGGVPSSLPNGALSLTVSKLQGGANFKTTGRDSVTLTGVIPNVAAPFSPAGQTLVLNIGGASVTFTLDKHGRGKIGQGSIALKLKSKQTKIAFGGGDVHFTANLRNGTWAARWGLDPNTTQNGTMTMLVTIQLAGNTYASSVALTYSSKAHVAAKFKNNSYRGRHARESVQLHAKPK